MIFDPRTFFITWEKKNNPYYPNGMKWDRNTILIVLNEYIKQIPNFIGRIL